MELTTTTNFTTRRNIQRSSAPNRRGIISNRGRRGTVGRQRSRSPTGQANMPDRWDSTQPENWSAKKLQDNLKEMNIVTPPGLSKTMLVKFYKANIQNRDARKNTQDIGGNLDEVAIEISSQDSTVEHDSTPGVARNSTDGNNMHHMHPAHPDSAGTANQIKELQDAVVSIQTALASHDHSIGMLSGSQFNQQVPAQNTQHNQVTMATSSQQVAQRGSQQNHVTQTNMAAPSVQSNMAAAMLQPNMATPSIINNTGTQNGIMSQPPSTPTMAGYTLQSVLYPFGLNSNNILNQGNQTHTGQFGIAADALPDIDTVPQHIRQKIIEGKDVNLVLLLVPSIDATKTKFIDCLSGEIKVKSDARLQRNLTLGEFITAFGRYKSIMSEVYPFRRTELDMYERDIIDMSHRFGGTTFYEYHKAFSAKAAAYLANRGIKIDWSVRDSKLYTSLFAGQKVLACELCKSMLHATGFCPLAADNPNRKGFNNKTNVSTNNTTDTKGRIRVKYQGKEICNDFNSITGCTRKVCIFQHVCTQCFAPHAAHQCTTPQKNAAQGQKQNQSSSANANKK